MNTSIITKSGVTLDTKAYAAYANYLERSRAYLSGIKSIEDLYDAESIDINLDCSDSIPEKVVKMLLRYYKRGNFYVQLLSRENFPEGQTEAISLAKQSRFWRFGRLQFNWGGKDHSNGTLAFIVDDEVKEFQLDDKDIIEMMTLTEGDYAKYF